MIVFHKLYRIAWSSTVYRTESRPMRDCKSTCSDYDLRHKCTYLLTYLLIRGVESESESLFWRRRLRLRAIFVILLQCIWLLCNVFYNWNSVRTPLCTFYWKEELKISLKSFLSSQSLCHTVSPRVGVRVPQKNEDSASLLLRPTMGIRTFASLSWRCQLRVTVYGLLLHY